MSYWYRRESLFGSQLIEQPPLFRFYIDPSLSWRTVSYGERASIRAVHAGDLPMLREIIVPHQVRPAWLAYLTRFAVFHRRPAIVAYLLHRGAPVTPDIYDLICFQEQNKSREIYQTLRANSDCAPTGSSLWWVLVGLDTPFNDAAPHLLKKEIDMASPEQLAYCAGCAFRAGQAKILRLLISAGAEVQGEPEDRPQRHRINNLLI